jgi:hypothetical protein
MSETFISDTFVVDADGWTPEFQKYETTWNPPGTAHDGELLLASLFPGVSQKAANPITSVVRPGDRGFNEVPYGSSNVQDASSLLHQVDTGHGLHALYRTVIDAFGGSIEFRADELRMYVTRSNTGSRDTYKATINVRSPSPTLIGNMVIVRLPIVR